MIRVEPDSRRIKYEMAEQGAVGGSGPGEQRQGLMRTDRSVWLRAGFICEGEHQK